MKANQFRRVLSIIAAVAVGGCSTGTPDARDDHVAEDEEGHSGDIVRLTDEQLVEADAQQLFVQTNIVYVDNLLRLQQAAALLEALMQAEFNEFNADDASVQDDNAQEVSP